MAVKVVQGLVRDSAATQQQVSSASQIKTAQSAAVQARAVSHFATVSGDAVLVSVRSRTAVGGGDRISDPKEAKKVADDVSDRIKETDEGAEAHGEIASDAVASRLDRTA